MNEVEYLAGLACDLNKDGLAAVADHCPDGPDGPATDRLAELDDRMFCDGAHGCADKLMGSKFRQQRANAAVGVDEHYCAAFIGSAADLGARVGLIGIDERGLFGVRRAFFDRKLDGFVHHLGGGRSVLVCAHCLSQDSMMAS